MASSDDGTDRELLRQARAGSAHAFAQFYRRYAPLVLAYFARRVSSREAAADLTMEVFAARNAALREARDGRDPGVLELLDRLPDAQRAAVRAFVVEERSHADIAREFKCSDLVVRKRVSRGLTAPRTALQR